MTSLKDVIIPNAKDVIVYRSVKKLCDRDMHPTLQEIADDVEMMMSTVEYCVQKLIKSGLIYKRKDTYSRNIRITTDHSSSDVVMLNDGYINHLDRKGILLFIADDEEIT